MASGKASWTCPFPGCDGTGRYHGFDPDRRETLGEHLATQHVARDVCRYMSNLACKVCGFCAASGDELAPHFNTHTEKDWVLVIMGEVAS